MSKKIVTKKRDAEVRWQGDSLEVLRSFPKGIQVVFGFSLRRMQQGGLPVCDCRSMSSVGEGVWELKDGDAAAWYRLMYLSRIGDTIYVLHTFKKDSRKTDPRDIATAKRRLSELKQKLLSEKKGK